MPIPILQKHIGKISESDNTLKANILKSILYYKASSIFKRISPYIKGKILDVGVGAGGIFSYLKVKGFKVEGIDVNDSSYIKEALPITYNGKDIPFSDKTFDTAIIVHVLHHCEDSIRVLTEALRVSKRVVVIEDTYRNDIEKSVVSINDSLGNFEFYSHKYHTSKEWEAIINRMGAKLVHMEEYTDFTYGIWYGRYSLFVIE